jgi:hypothetical protein
METYRIKMKIGVHEFEAEGPQDLVTAQFDAFKELISSGPKGVTAPNAASAFTQTNGSAINPATPTDVSQAILDRVFSKGNPLSLAALPSGDNAASNALLILLYGFLKINGEQNVTGTMLNKAAKKSGVVNIDRIDRAMSVHQPDLVLTAGAKKGRKYSLNNRGIARAEEIIRTLVQ